MPEADRLLSEQARISAELAQTREARPADMPPGRRTDTELRELGASDLMHEWCEVDQYEQFISRKATIAHGLQDDNDQMILAAETTQ